MLSLSQLKQEHENLVEKLSAANLDTKERATLQKQAQEAATLIDLMQTKESLFDQIEQCKKMLELEPEMTDLINEEINELEKQNNENEKEILNTLCPPDPKNNRPCFVEIRAGAGGQEASLFVLDLVKMYSVYAQNMGWHSEIHSIAQTDVGGAREAIIYIKGKSAYGNLKFESGVHRVQRVPATETKGRTHTSTVTVAVMPEADEVDININPNDLRIDVYRSSGAGGQHVNTTDSAVRVTHIPTGVVVTCQDERSQLKNKLKALKELRSRILEAETRKAEAQRSSERKSQIGSGDRSEKIRTYNYPQNRVTDHRINLTVNRLEYIVNGDLDEIVQALISQDLKERLIDAGLLQAED